MPNNLKIEYVPIDEIKTYPNNAKLHPAEQIEQIKKSIQEFGFNDPIAIDENNVIIEGHGRLIACQELGIKEIPIIRLNELSDEQKRAYMLVHNKLTMNTDFDIELLNDELDNISFDMSEYGFDMEIEEEPEQEIEEVDTPEPPKEPKSKLGDIYQLGNHRLMCGDSTDEQQVSNLLGGEVCELTFTDPPYGIDIVNVNNKVGGDKPFGKVGGDKIVKSKEYMPIKGDNTTDTSKLSYEIYKKYSNNQIIFGGNYFTDFLKPSPCWIIWDKQNTGNFADVELAWTSLDKSAKLYQWLWNGMIRKGDVSIEGKTRVHPTQKPVGLIANILKDFSNENNSILDVFGGSGSTLIACEQTNRKCYCMEYEPRYVDVIIERWENYTGKKAVKIC